MHVGYSLKAFHATFEVISMVVKLLLLCFNYSLLVSKPRLMACQRAMCGWPGPMCGGGDGLNHGGAIASVFASLGHGHQLILFPPELAQPVALSEPFKRSLGTF